MVQQRPDGESIEIDNARRLQLLVCIIDMLVRCFLVLQQSLQLVNVHSVRWVAEGPGHMAITNIPHQVPVVWNLCLGPRVDLHAVVVYQGLQFLLGEALDFLERAFALWTWVGSILFRL